MFLRKTHAHPYATLMNQMLTSGWFLKETQKHASCPFARSALRIKVHETKTISKEMGVRNLIR